MKPALAALCVAVLCLGIFLGCVPARGGWDSRRLEAEHPELDAFRGHRLGDLLPFFAPTDSEIQLFLCRWNISEAIPVSLPRNATADEGESLRLALAAWSLAIPGLEFSAVDSGRGSPGFHRRGGVIPWPGIEIELADEEGADEPPGTGDAIADCAVAFPVSYEDEGQRLVAELAHAEIRLRRTKTDALGLRQIMTPDEFLGAAMHELGHALGVSGHIARGSSIMVSAPEESRRVGAAVRAGRPWSFATVGALYAVPSGWIVGSRQVDPRDTELIRQLAGLAGSAGWPGPYARSGGGTARFFWRSDAQARMAWIIAPWPTPNGGASVRLVPGELTRRLLGED